MNYLAISVLGDAELALIDKLARIIADCKCNIIESRMSLMGEVSGLIMLVQGNWNTLSRLETHLDRLGKEYDHALSIHWQRTQKPKQTEIRPYMVEVSALDKPGILEKVAGFFASRNIHIQEMLSRSYNAPPTAAAMTAVQLVIGVPTSTHIGELREEFMEFCDDFNWDAVLEPFKNYL